MLSFAIPGPASADKAPVTAAQLKQYNDVFMSEVRQRDLLFHGEADTATLRDMVNGCIEKPYQGEQIDNASEAMKALEAVSAISLFWAARWRAPAGRYW